MNFIVLIVIIACFSLISATEINSKGFSSFRQQIIEEHTNQIAHEKVQYYKYGWYQYQGGYDQSKCQGIIPFFQLILLDGEAPEYGTGCSNIDDDKSWKKSAYNQEFETFPDVNALIPKGQSMVVYRYYRVSDCSVISEDDWKPVSTYAYQLNYCYEYHGTATLYNSTGYYHDPWHGCAKAKFPTFQPFQASCHADSDNYYHITEEIVYN